MTTPSEKHPFQDIQLPLDERVKDLVSRFTLEEKIEMMCQYQPEISRLGVQAYKHGTEAAHGISWLGEATVYPQPFGLACTWNPVLMKRIGSAIGDEARAFYKRNPTVNGLTLWAPTVDVERDPLWGRTEEAYGEDPHLIGELSTALVQGMQGDHPTYYKSIATLKHFIGNNNEVDRGSASVSLDPRNMKEYYLNAFKPAIVEGNAQSIMTAYNAVNGTPAILHHDVKEIVKGEWNMDGFIVSDAGDMQGNVDDHHYFETYAESVAASIKSGIDSVTDDKDKTIDGIKVALEKGMLAEKDLDQALFNTFRVRFRLGEFDPEELNPYAAINDSVVGCQEHSALSLQAAKESLVLLKNEQNTLPLSKEKLNKVAVIGPMGNKVYEDWYCGTLPYSITPFQAIREKLAGKEVSFTEGTNKIRLKAKANQKYVTIGETEEQPILANGSTAAEAEVFHHSDWGWGCHTLKSSSTDKYVTTETHHYLNATAKEARGWFVKEVFNFEQQQDGTAALTSWDNKYVEAPAAEQDPLAPSDSKQATAAALFEQEVVEDGIVKAVEAAKTADTAIVFVGNNPFINGKETIDRPDLVLPPAQEKLIQEVFKANPNTIVVVIGSYPYAINWADEHIPAIIYSSHGGQELGTALADVLFGEYAPAGRLNMTWYASKEQFADIMEYDIIKHNRTYMYFDGKPLYPFGHGLTYANFTYSKLELSAQSVAANAEVNVSVDVQNSGDIASHEVVQLYVKAEQSRVKRPLKELRGFQKLFLQPGEKERVTFTLPIEELAFWDVTREKYCVESGTYTLMVGKSSSDIQLQESLEVLGETVPARDLSQETKAINYDDYQDVYLDEIKAGGNCIAAKTASAWIKFADVEFEEGVSFFEAHLSAEAEGLLELYLDGVKGELVGKIEVAATGGAQKWETVRTSIDSISGEHHVFIKLSQGMRLNTFTFHK